MIQKRTHLLIKFLLPLFIGALVVHSADSKVVGMIKDGKYKNAVTFIEKSYPSEKRDVDTWLHYAEALEKSGAEPQKVADALLGAQKAQPSDPRVFAETGAFFMRQKKYKKALKPLQKAYLLKQTAKAAEAMADCAMYLKDYDLARDAAESALRIDSTTIEARKMLSFIHMNEKDWASAVIQLEFVVAKNKDDLKYWRKLVLCYTEQKNRDKVAEASVRIAQLDGKDVASRTMLAGYYLDKGDNDAALPYLKELAVLTPEDAGLFKKLYTISIANKQKNDAVLYLRNFIVLDSTDAQAYSALGELLYEQKKHDDALKAFRKARALDPKITGMYRPYCALLLEKKQEKELVAVIKMAEASGEVDAPVYAAVGAIYKKRKQYAVAASYFQKALKTDVKNLVVLSALAECQEKTGKTADALLNYQQVVMLNPDVVEEYKYLGNLLWKQKKYPDAIEQYQKYLVKKQDDQGIAAKVGGYYFDLKQCKEAISFYEKVSSAKILTVPVCMDIAECYYELDNYKKAIEYYKKARAKKPSTKTLARLLKPLAVSLEKTDAKVEAAKVYEAFVKLPGVNDAEASFKQAWFREAVDRASAMKLYQENIAAFPKDVRSYTRLGILMSESKGMVAKAIPVLESARKLSPEDTLILLKLCDAYYNVKNRRKVLESAKWVVALHPGHLTANTRAGTILFQQKKYNDAIPYLEKVVAAQPKNSEMVQMLAEAYMQIKQPAKAAAMYETARQLQPDNVKVKLSLIAAVEASGQTKKVAGYREELAVLDRKLVEKNKKAVDPRLRLATFYYDKNDFKAAFSVYKELAELVPKNREVFSRLVAISQKNGKDKETLTWLNRYVVLDPSNAKVHAQIGDLQYKQKNSDAALEHYRKAAALDTSLGGFYKNYASLVMAKNLSKEADRVLSVAISKGEAEQAMYVYLGKMYQQQKKYSSAVAMFKQASSNDPKNLALLSLLGECQAENNELSNAILTYQQVVMLNPKAVKEYKALGNLLVRRKKTDDAMKAYRKYLEKAMDDTVARTVGLHIYGEKNYKEAVLYLDRVKDRKLHSRAYLLALGDAALQLKDCKKVCEVYGRLFTKKAPASLLKKILRPLGECYEKINDPVNAAVAYDAYVRLPGVADADASYLSVYLKEKNDPKAAEALYIANIKSFPKDSRNHLRLGVVYAADRKTMIKATGYLNQAAKLNPKEPLTFETLANVWKSLGNATKELAAYKKLLALVPQNIAANRRAGELYMKQKMYKSAIACLEIAAATAPDDDGLTLMLADAYIATGRKDRGVELLSKLSLKQNKNTALLVRLYELHKELGTMKEAEVLVKKLIALSKDVTYKVWYAKDLVTLKRLDEAKKIADEIVGNNAESVDGLMLQGKILVCRNKPDDAMELFKMVSYVDEDYAPANFERAEIYRKKMDYSRAETYYSKALKADPKIALAELGLALVFKAQNNKNKYKVHLDKARALDPGNRLIRDEVEGKSSAAKVSTGPKEKVKTDEGKKNEVKKETVKKDSNSSSDKKGSSSKGKSKKKK